MRDMVCKGICVRHKANKPIGEGRYATGQKRCQVCEIFLNWNGLWCPCCGYRLRTRPRNLKFKAKLRENKKGGEEIQEPVPKARQQQVTAKHL
jgi:hypothetical protein